MKTPHPFEQGERICFIGDSITANCDWISAIAEYYATTRKNEKIKIIPCGIAGGGLISALTYYNECVAHHNPTTAVIMLGMNDIGRQHYEGEIDDIKLKNQKVALQNYERNLYALTNQLKTISRVKRIIFLTPTPYDSGQDCGTPNVTGCLDALRGCAEIMKKVADENDSEYYDTGLTMYNLLCEVRERGFKEEFIKPDRVHPNLLGMSVMARLFLACQGFADMAISADNIINGEILINLSEEAQNFDRAAKKVQERWTSEWIIARASPDHTQQGKFKFTNNYEKYVPGMADMFNNLAKRYEGLVNNYSNNVEELYSAINALYINIKEAQ